MMEVFTFFCFGIIDKLWYQGMYMRIPFKISPKGMKCSYGTKYINVLIVSHKINIVLIATELLIIFLFLSFGFVKYVFIEHFHQSIP